MAEWSSGRDSACGAGNRGSNPRPGMFTDAQKIAQRNLEALPVY